MKQIRLINIVLALLAGLYATVAWGSLVSISPVRVHLSASRRSEVLLLRNSGTTPTRFQITGHSWRETHDGEMVLAPTGDILFFPSLLEIKPGDTRRVRMTSTLAPGRMERSYRIVVTELPQSLGPSGGVQVLTKLNLPVFVQPAGAAAKPIVRTRVESGRVVVSVENEGNSYFKTQSVRVVARTATGEAVFEQTLPGWYVLAQGRRDYRLELPQGVCARLASVTATATTERGKASGAARVQLGAECGN